MTKGDLPRFGGRSCPVGVSVLEQGLPWRHCDLVWWRPCTNPTTLRPPSLVYKDATDCPVGSEPAPLNHLMADTYRHCCVVDEESSNMQERLRQYSLLNPAEAWCKACEHPVPKAEVEKKAQYFNMNIRQYLEYMCQLVYEVEGSKWSKSDELTCKEKARADARMHAKDVPATEFCSDCNPPVRRGRTSANDRGDVPNLQL